MDMELIGNSSVRTRLRELADGGRLHHCLLFEGPQGIGKASSALWLAMTVNCEADEPARPCGSCWSCRQIPKGQHPDVIQLGLDLKKATPIISVSQAREVLQQLMLRPFHARHRFVIIDPMDAMTPAAANAMLKTFEEPPGATGFILVSSSAASLLPTVRSRSQRIRFAPVSTDELTAWLEAKGVEDPAEVARLAEGCPGRALGLSVSDAAAWRASRDALMDALSLSVDERFKFSEKMARGDRAAWTSRLEDTLTAVSAVLRDALAAECGGPPIYNTDRPQLVQRWGERLGPEGIAQLAGVVGGTRDNLAHNVNGRLLMDSFMAHLVRALSPPRRHS
jgi:DNA polymerase-3 subunit delta'